jgi:NitT/TauT family transport system substrate-binding protein
VWTVEPWVSRLELEAEGEVLVEDREAITTVLVARADLLASQQGLVRKLVDAHRELTGWIVKNPAEAQRMAREELDEEMRTKFAPELIAKAWGRIVVTGDVTLDSLKKFVASAQSVGFLRGAPDISSLVVSP